MDPNMSNLLKWSIQNSSASTTPTDSATTNPTTSSPATTTAAADLIPPSSSALSSLLGLDLPSDADLMRASVSAINSPDNTLPNKLVAFDNLEQLLESIDNANNLEPLGLWAPLLEQLDSEEPDLRRMAAWCVGTAVQNNEKAQERLLTHNALPKLITLATSDANEAVRRKAIYALSSAMRNFQPATDEALKTLPEEYVRDERVEAGDMQALDNIINNLREQAQPQSQSRQKGTEVEMSPK